MRCIAKFFVAVAFVAVQTTVWAKGDRLHLATDFGPLSLRIDWDAGSIEGAFPKYDGHLFGELTDAGRSMRGVWVQRRNDHPCVDTRYGSRSWGHFVFTYGGQVAPGARMAGSWGYCDEEPHRPWNGQVLN